MRTEALHQKLVICAVPKPFCLGLVCRYVCILVFKNIVDLTDLLPSMAPSMVTVIIIVTFLTFVFQNVSDICVILRV